ncbi:putative chromatin remodeling & transcription regulator BTB-POZ family [Helianthus anomalus]
MHFRHILNWLRDGVAQISNLSDLECSELLREAEYYQLLVSQLGSFTPVFASVILIIAFIV